MPVYAVRIRGQSDVRLVKAATASQARNHIVEAETVTAEELADYVDDGSVIEKATRPVDEEKADDKPKVEAETAPNPPAPEGKDSAKEG